MGKEGGGMPFAEAAVVSERKITEYLLSESQPPRKRKAGFFKRFGFSLSRPEELEGALLLHARQGSVIEVDHTQYGQQYVLAGELQTPDGRNPPVITVWLIPAGRQRPHFVTAYRDRRATRR